MLLAGWRHLRRCEPCPVCGRGAQSNNRNSHCTVTVDGSVVCCQKSGGMAVGDVRPFKQGKSGGHLYRLGDSSSSPAYHPREPERKRRPNFNRLFAGWWSAVHSQKLAAHADVLGVNVDSLIRLQIGWAAAARDKDGRTVIAGTDTYCRMPGAWVFPLRDARGDIAGARVRTATGGKYAVQGSNGGGVFIPGELPPNTPLYFPEGPTNTAALLSLGMNAVGRPANASGAEAIIGVINRLSPSRVYLVGDNDERLNFTLGRNIWPGKDGAERIQQQLAAATIYTTIVYPPSGFKDVRDWYRSGVLRGTSGEQIHGLMEGGK